MTLEDLVIHVFKVVFSLAFLAVIAVLVLCFVAAKLVQAAWRFGFLRLAALGLHAVTWPLRLLRGALQWTWRVLAATLLSPLLALLHAVQRPLSGLVTAPGTGAALRRAAPARAAAAAVKVAHRLSPALAIAVPRSLFEALWLAAVVISAAVAATSALSLGWRSLSAPQRRSMGTLFTGVLVAAASQEAMDASIHALTTGLWAAAAVRCVGAFVTALAGCTALDSRLNLGGREQLRRSLHAAPVLSIALLCASAGAQTAVLPPPEVSPWAVLLSCATLFWAAGELICYELELEPLLMWPYRGVLLLAGDVRRILSQPLPPRVLRALQIARLSTWPLLCAASAAMLAGSALAPARPLVQRAAFAAAASGQLLVAAVMAGFAMQCSRTPRIARAGVKLEAAAAAGYRQLDLPAFLLLKALVPRVIRAYLVLRRVLRTGIRLTTLLAAALRHPLAIAARPFRAAWNSPNASLFISLAVLTAALAGRIYAAPLLAAWAAVSAFVAAHCRVVASCFWSAHQGLPASLSSWAYAGYSSARSAVASADAVLAMGAHSSPAMAAALVALHVAQAHVLWRVFAVDEDNATTTALTSFFVRNAGVALLLPLLGCHVGAALGATSDGWLATTARAAVPLGWAALAACLAVECLARLVPARIARAARGEQAEAAARAPVRANGADACTLCLEALNNGPPVRMLRCGHAFHEPCARVWEHLLQERRCPTCRARVEGEAYWRDVLFE